MDFRGDRGGVLDRRWKAAVFLMCFFVAEEEEDCFMSCCFTMLYFWKEHLEHYSLWMHAARFHYYTKSRADSCFNCNNETGLGNLPFYCSSEEKRSQRWGEQSFLSFLSCRGFTPGIFSVYNFRANHIWKASPEQLLEQLSAIFSASNSLIWNPNPFDFKHIQSLHKMLFIYRRWSLNHFKPYFIKHIRPDHLALKALLGQVLPLPPKNDSAVGDRPALQHNIPAKKHLKSELCTLRQ